MTTPEEDLSKLHEQATQVIISAQPQTKQKVTNALNHVLETCGYKGSAYAQAVEIIVDRSGQELQKIDGSAGQAMIELCATLFDISIREDGWEIIDAFLASKNITGKFVPNQVDDPIYNRLCGGHVNSDDFVNWLTN